MKIFRENSITSADHLGNLSNKLTQLKLYYLILSDSVSVTGCLSVLVVHCFPMLDTLVLRKCALNSDDLRSLAQANKQSNIPGLQKLYISLSKIPAVPNLFSFSSKWNYLLSLATNDVNVLM